MSSSSLLDLLLCAHIVGQISALLNATVGGSVLIPCSVNPVRWFYWQEDQSDNILFHWDASRNKLPVAEKYRNRCQVFNTEFTSGNISIRLNNINIGDDQKTFWAFVEFYDKQGKVTRGKYCKLSLQVSAPYHDLALTINNTVNGATCTARGGYPEPRVSWTGQNKSSTAHQEMPDAQTSLQQDPTEKTFSVTSTVSIKELQSVTCSVHNPRSNQSIETTKEIDAPGEDPNHHTIFGAIGAVAVCCVLVLVPVCWYLKKKCKKTYEEAQSAENQADLAAIELLNLAAKEDTAAAATADAEEKTNLLSDSKDETNATESDKDK